MYLKKIVDDVPVIDITHASQEKLLNFVNKFSQYVNVSLISSTIDETLLSRYISIIIIRMKDDSDDGKEKL